MKRAATATSCTTEGAELKVLLGSSGIFGGASKPRLALIELFDKNLSVFDPSIGDISQMMKHWDYRAYVLVDGRKEFFAPVHHNMHYNVF